MSDELKPVAAPTTFPARVLSAIEEMANPEKGWEDGNGYCIVDDAALALAWIAKRSATPSQPVGDMQEVEAAPLSARMLTEDETRDAFAIQWDESGPYPQWMERMQAVMTKFCEVNGIRLQEVKP